MIVALDLDRTLIYSRAAMGEDQFARLPIECVEIYQGKPLSYMTTRAAQLLRDLSAQTPVVPSTTRTPAQFQRIDLPGGPFRHAVVSSGARILVDGVDDPEWRRQVEQRVAALPADLDAVVTELNRRVDDSWVRSLRVADDIFCYLVVDLDHQPADFLPSWQQWCAAREWVVSQQGRKIYALPTVVTKSAAVREVRRRLVAEATVPADTPIGAAGDGMLDAELLLAADLGIRPRHGELELTGWHHDHVAVTESSGAPAAEELLEWLAQRVSTHVNHAPPTEFARTTQEARSSR